MTVEEFKKLKPELSHLEGDDLLNSMEDFMLRQQSGDKIIMQTKPFWKRYKLRYLFYMAIPNKWIFHKNDYKCNKRCSSCKKGTIGSFGMIYMGRSVMFCPHGCGELTLEPNTNINHKLYVLWASLANLFLDSLQFLHILKRSHSGRYDMFGDEYNYVRSHTYHTGSGKITYNLKGRKWFEYIFIKK